MQHFSLPVKMHVKLSAPVAVFNSEVIGYWLELNDLRFIPLEHVIGVAQYYYGIEMKEYNREHAIAHVRKAIENFRLGKATLIYSAYQYLQRLGYALPWNGFTIFQLLNAGWIKYKIN